MHLFKLAAFSLLTFGCVNSTIEPKHSDVIPVEKPKSKKESCAAIQRNLNMNWEQRKYWCAPEEFKTKQKPKQLSHKNQKKLSSSDKQKSATNIVRILQNLSKDDLEIILGKLASAYEQVIAKQTTSSTVKTYASTARINEAELVWFAPSIEVLGPQGRKKIESLIAGNAGKILLRGYASEKLDTKCDDLDQLAVGRALSVRKMLQAHGIDESKIKILYRDKAKSGRFVEVAFNG